MNVVATSKEVFIASSGVKRKKLPTTFYVVPGLITVLKISVIEIVKPVTINMNPIFTKVTLGSFIFVMLTFCMGTARKFGIIGNTACHQASFYLLHIATQWKKSDRQLANTIR